MLTDSARHLSVEELEAGLERIRLSPKDEGSVDLIVRRPESNDREVLVRGELDLAAGLAGDNWASRGSRSMSDGSSDPDMQLTVMNSRVVALVANVKERWPLAGDQIYVDLDLSKENLPAGTRLQLGAAIIEVTSPPHTGCKKFVARFGLEAMKFVNSGLGKKLCLRGINARVVKSGAFEVGDSIQRLPHHA